MLVGGSLPGRCTCLLEQSVPLGACTARAGVVTQTDASKLCGYLPPPFDAMSSLRPSAVYTDLVMTPCYQVETAICATVYMPSGQSVLMSVAVSLFHSQRRRLLSDPESELGPLVFTYESEYEALDPQAREAILALPGWNETAEPCAGLAYSHFSGEHLGPMERHELGRCVYWRHVGRRIARVFNLTALARHDTFLLGLDDFAAALADPDVVGELLAEPWVLARVTLYHPWLKPVRSLAVTVSNMVEHVFWNRSALLARAGDTEAELLDAIYDDLDLLDIPSHTGGRRLLVSYADAIVDGVVPPNVNNVRDQLLGIKAMTNELLSGSSDPIVVARIAQAWTQEPFSWPPRYDWIHHTCPLGTAMVDVGVQVFTVTAEYYSNFGSQSRLADRSFQAALPRAGWLRLNSTRASQIARSPAQSWASLAVRTVLGAFSLGPGDVLGFVASEDRWSLTWILRTSLKCDAVAVMTCSEHKADLIMTIVVFLLLYFIIQLLASALGLGALATAFWYSGPFFVLWYAYGYSFACAPMVPTCLLEDIVAAATQLVPQQITFPRLLLCDRGNSTAPVTCLRSCAELNFTDWEHPVAFALCDMSSGWCDTLLHAHTGVPQVDSALAPLLAGFHRALLDANQTTRDPDAAQAARLCTWVTWVASVPVLAFFVAVSIAAGALLVATAELGPPAVAVLTQAVVYSRAPHRA